MGRNTWEAFYRTGITKRDVQTGGLINPWALDTLHHSGMIAIKIGVISRMSGIESTNFVFASVVQLVRTSDC